MSNINIENPDDNSIIGKIYSFVNKVDSSIDEGLEKTNTVLELVIKVFTNVLSFIKKSIELKKLKKVFFIIIMSIIMAFVLVGVNIFFGKVIL